MRRYKMKETEEISGIICNQCGKEIRVVNSRPEEEVLSVITPGDTFQKRTASATASICVNPAMINCLLRLRFLPMCGNRWRI